MSATDGYTGLSAETGYIQSYGRKAHMRGGMGQLGSCLAPWVPQPTSRNKAARGARGAGIGRGTSGSMGWRGDVAIGATEKVWFGLASVT